MHNLGKNEVTSFGQPAILIFDFCHNSKLSSNLIILGRYPALEIEVREL